MKKILFRGKSLTTNIYIYGDLIHDKQNNTYIFNAEFESINFKESIEKVDKDTIQYYLNNEWHDL